MREGKRLRGRTVAAFVAGSLIMGAFSLSITPVSAHLRKADGSPVSIAHLVKHLRQHFVGTDTLVTWGPIAMNVGDAEQVIMTRGPFTWVAGCDQPDGENTGVFAFIKILTSEDNSFFDNEQDFDISDNNNPEFWAGNSGFPPGGSQNGGTDWQTVVSPSGLTVQGVTNVVTNFAGAHCTFRGRLIAFGV